jgi:opacity protein-like surface antigen
MNSFHPAAPALALAISLASSPTAAEEINVQALYELVKEQGELIAELRQELDEAKSQLSSTEDKVVITEERLESTVEFIEEQSVTTAGGNWWNRTSIGGYGEIHYNDIDADDSSRSKKETDIHRYVLFVNHEFNDRVRFFSELEIEHGLVKDTADGSNGGEVEVEQAYVEIDLNENHQARGGLFLLPVGILNETHEPPTFYGVERNDVENILLPSTWWENGVGFSGQYENGLSWDFALHSGLEVPTSGGSAGRIRSGRQKSSNASAEDLAYTARVSYSGVPGLQLAASYQHQTDISQMGSDGLDSADLITAHAIYNNGPFQLRALYADWSIDGSLAQALEADDQSGWYIEPSVRFASDLFTANGSWGTYLRYEDLDGARTQDRFEQWEVGVNIWPTENVVFKIDYRDREHDLSTESGRDFQAIDLGVGFQF